MTTVEELMKKGVFELNVMAAKWSVTYITCKNKTELSEGIIAHKGYYGEPPKREKQVKKKYVHKKCDHGKRKGLCKVCDDRYLCCHGRQKYFCKECGGTMICQHEYVKYMCAKCRREEKEDMVH